MAINKEQRRIQRAIVVRGRLIDPTHIELDEPVDEIQGPVEVIIRAVDSPEDVFLQKLHALPQAKQDEAADFVEFLSARHAAKNEGLMKAKSEQVARPKRRSSIARNPRDPGASL